MNSVETWETPGLYYVDPFELVLDDNAREIDDIRVKNPGLCDSVAKYGVKTAVTANPDENGNLRLRYGFSRVLANRLCVDKHPTIPVVVVEAGEEDEAQRLIDQWDENTQRVGYTQAEEVQIFERMALFDLAPEEIAAKLSTTADRVTAGLAVARSAATREALREDDQLTLEQYAALTEFESDPEAHADLLDTLRSWPGNFAFSAARWRRKAARRAACAEAADELRARGEVVIVDDELPDNAARLHDLHADENGELLTVGNHAGCPGHALFLDTDAYHSETVKPVPICTDWAQHGHTQAANSGGPGERPAEDLTAERRRVIRNNKAWVAAQDVRRDKLKALLAKKTPPKQVEQFIATTLMIGEHELQKALPRHHPLVCELLGYSEPAPGTIHPVLAELRKATAARAKMITLGLLVAAFEHSLRKDTWRAPTEEQKRYFRTLAEWGFDLHWVERMVNDPSAETEADAEPAAETTAA
ncbi:ParB/RepB/Spo0J family partition protein [Amycolatopsis thermoflava]|uniref:ParB/RepB/Spo0J family partition protein n=1 Tax=Amycolatopsis thermoflava TaxID=84480 RepID=UPI003813A8BF